MGTLWSAPGLIIQNPSNYSINSAELNHHYKVAYDLFSREVGSLNVPLTVAIAPGDCVRTGYNFVSNQVVFCSNDKVINLGLDSVDVIYHEMFHAFMCNYSRNLCGSNMRVDVHEGLADYFAYLLNPDRFFGENYYREFSYIREYRTSFRPGLVQGDHERGNAYASAFIQARTPLRNAIRLFSSPPQQEEVDDVISGPVKSKLNRYRLRPNEIMGISFNFAPAAQVARVVWKLPNGILVQELSPTSFNIKASQEVPASKAFAIFLGRNGAELGSRTYYFGAKFN